NCGKTHYTRFNIRTHCRNIARGKQPRPGGERCQKQSLPACVRVRPRLGTGDLPDDRDPAGGTTFLQHRGDGTARKTMAL
ncbi:hypothetical protein, partial [Vibrio sonorensis]|uniref:hypothetical protein n=1 Tax=Vibrio sonorensis TaxID=1004316 RepID=UPI001C304334